MGTHFVRFVPEDCRHTPSDAALTAASRVLERRCQGHPVSVQRGCGLQFVDAGQCAGAVRCPQCGGALDDVWWSDAMSAAWREVERRFGELRCTTPCCGASTTLHELDYEAIGQSIECSPESARAHVFQALRKIRTTLNGHVQPLRESTR